MALLDKWTKDLKLDFVEETKWNLIYESKSHVFIFSKNDDDVKVKRKRLRRTDTTNKDSRL